MNAAEASGEDVPLTPQKQQQQPQQQRQRQRQRQQQQQERSHQQQTRKKKDDEDKVSTAGSIQHHHQLKPNQFHRPSGSSLSSVESIELVHVRRPLLV